MVLLEFSERRFIPATLSPLLDSINLGLMLSKIDIIKFGNPSWIHQNYFWNSLRQTSKFTWNEIDNWCNFAASFMSQICTMKLTESINICYFSVRVVRTIKETFMGNDGFLQIFISWMDCSQRIKDLLLHKWSIFQGRTYSCYSGKPWTYLKQGWYCKVWQSIIHWYMDLLTLSYHLQYAKRLAT